MKMSRDNAAEFYRTKGGTGTSVSLFCFIEQDFCLIKQDWGLQFYKIKV